MKKNKKKSFYCLLTFFTIYFLGMQTPQIFGSEEGSNSSEDLYLYTPKTSPRNKEELPISAEEDENLSLYFQPSTSVWIPDTSKHVATGLTSGFFAGLFTSVIGPVGIKTFETLGVTKEVIPTGGWESIIYGIGVAAVPFIIGGVAAYHSVTRRGALYKIGETTARLKNWCSAWWPCGASLSVVEELTADESETDTTDSSPPTYEQAKEAVTQRDLSRAERLIYTPSTPITQLLVMGGLSFGVVWEIEAGLDPSWEPLAWQIGLGILSLPVSYNVFIHPGRNPNKNVAWRWVTRFFKDRTNDEEIFRQKQECLGLIKDVRDIIKTKGLTSTIRHLCETFTISVPETLVNQETALRAQTGYIPNTNQNQYICAFKDMLATSKDLNPSVKAWREESERIATTASLIISIASFPVKLLVLYSIPYNLLKLCDASGGYFTLISSLTTAFLSPFLMCGSIQEHTIIRQEWEHLLDRFYSPSSGWGRPGILARLVAPLYFNIYLMRYLVTKTLGETMGIPLPGGIVLAVPLGMGIISAASNQFFNTQFERISDACSSCINTTGERKVILELLRKLEEMEDKVWELNDTYTQALHKSIYSSPHKNNL